MNEQPWGEELARSGLQDLEAHRYEAAAQQLEAAYRLLSDPNLLVSFSAALRSLGRPAEAARRLEARLGQAEGLSVDQRQALERELEQARAQVSNVRITTIPEGAQLAIDGDHVGRTPLSAPLVLDAGEHQLLVQLDGHRDDRRTLQLEASTQLDLSVQLEPLEVEEAGADRPLDLSLWIIAGLAALSTAGAATTLVVAVELTNQTEDILYLSPEVTDRAQRWRYASYAMCAVAGAMVTTAVSLAVVRAVRQRRLREQRDAQRGR